jgi:aryl-alcohol dehydrogenase-like predicted oxidoreductase
MHSLHNLVASSKVLYLGISNTPAWVVSKANEYARNNSLTPFVVYQGRWSAAERDIEREIIPMCDDEGMAVAPFSTLGSGYFKTAAQRTALASTLKDGRNTPFIDSPSKVVVAETLERIAAAKGTSITSVAMAYIMHKAPYVFPILGGRTTEQLNSNIQALGLKLSQEQMKEIDAAVPFDFGYPQTFLGGAGGAVSPKDVWMTQKFGRFDWVQKPRVSCKYNSVCSFLC